MADIELGSPFSNSARRNIDKLMPRWSQLGRLLRLALFKWQSFSRKKDDIRVNRRFQSAYLILLCQHVSDMDQVEDYRKGYPRFTALMSAHGAFHIFRRFTSVRVRLLLLAQDKISCLEDQLLKIDEEEKAPLFLASCREDKNPEREAIISELHSNLATYGKISSTDTKSPYKAT
ncbi:hypothetical protein F5Y08DRAFT_346389 [Xylaria arbuscula]|nr:hypothetical protein F5Y08DRAFT_346389 [Xylaria arbuscula]